MCQAEGSTDAAGRRLVGLNKPYAKDGPCGPGMTSEARPSICRILHHSCPKARAGKSGEAACVVCVENNRGRRTRKRATSTNGNYAWTSGGEHKDSVQNCDAAGLHNVTYTGKRIEMHSGPL